LQYGAALFALAAAGHVMAEPVDQLAGSEWRPVEIAGRTMTPDAPLYIRFEAGARISAHGGCNRMGGGYKIDKASLRIGPLRSTRKACEYEVMQLENAFAKALEGARLFLRDGTKLTLKTAQGVTTMRLAQTDRD
jgi:heat shock protein HslJ